MRHRWLADALRAGGLTVVEYPRWEDRGAPTLKPVEVIVCHHTATPAKATGDLPTLGLLIDGRPDLPGPLCQLALSRSGAWHALSSGKANHAGKGAWRHTTSSLHTIGIEAEHPGDGSAWTAVQLDSYVRGVAALCRFLGLPPEAVCGHLEWALPAGRKVDPRGFLMDDFRADVAALLTDRPTTWEDPDMARLWLDPRDKRTQWAVTSDGMRRLANPAEVAEQQAAGLLAPGRPEPVSPDRFAAHQALTTRVQEAQRKGLVTADSWSTTSQTLELVVTDVSDLRVRVDSLERAAGQ